MDRKSISLIPMSKTLKKPKPGTMFRYTDKYGNTHYVEVERITATGGIRRYECRMYEEDLSPIEMVSLFEETVEATMSALEIARVYGSRRSTREVTFEDEEGYAFIKTFRQYT